MNVLEKALAALEKQYNRAKGCGGCKSRRERLAKEIEEIKVKLGLSG